LPNICILTETFYPEIGGGETQARSLAEGLRRQGWNALVLTRRSRTGLNRYEVVNGVPVYRILPNGAGHGKKWGLVLSSFPALIRLRHQYDVVFVSGFRILGITAVMVSTLLGKTCILKADSLGEMSGEYFAAGLARLRLRPSLFVFRFFLSLRNRLLKQADAFVAISSVVADELAAQNVRASAIEMIPNSVDTDRFCPVDPPGREALRRKLGLPLGHKIVIYTGRLVSYKGLPLLLRVWREIQRDHSDVRLLLVGSGGLDIHNCEAELKAYVDTDGLRESIHFTGSVDNVHEYLQASDIFIFPTEQEAFGISLIEAMACGLPVISTPAGGVKDIVEHQRNGLVVQPGDSQQLSEALNALINDAALGVRLGDAARHTARREYSAEIVTEVYAELFERICSSVERKQ
jgi:glycosyltransferase involved in cell wall biosynthesis